MLGDFNTDTTDVLPSHAVNKVTAEFTSQTKTPSLLEISTQTPFPEHVATQSDSTALSASWTPLGDTPDLLAFLKQVEPIMSEVLMRSLRKRPLPPPRHAATTKLHADLLWFLNVDSNAIQFERPLRLFYGEKYCLLASSHSARLLSTYPRRHVDVMVLDLANICAVAWIQRHGIVLTGTQEGHVYLWSVNQLDSPLTSTNSLQDAWSGYSVPVQHVSCLSETDEEYSDLTGSRSTSTHIISALYADGKLVFWKFDREKNLLIPHRRIAFSARDALGRLSHTIPTSIDMPASTILHISSSSSSSSISVIGTQCGSIIRTSLSSILLDSPAAQKEVPSTSLKHPIVKFPTHDSYAIQSLFAISPSSMSSSFIPHSSYGPDFVLSTTKHGFSVFHVPTCSVTASISFPSHVGSVLSFTFVSNHLMCVFSKGYVLSFSVSVVQSAVSNSGSAIGTTKSEGEDRERYEKVTVKPYEMVHITPPNMKLVVADIGNLEGGVGVCYVDDAGQIGLIRIHES